MIYRSTTPDRRPASRRRAGRIGFFLLGILALTFLFGILVINSYFVTEIRAQQENATDAAALAAAEVLVSEGLLFGDPAIFDLSKCKFGVSADAAQVQSPFCNSVNTALAFATKNFVGGKAFQVQGKEVFFDIVDIPNRVNRGTMPAVNSDLLHANPLTLAQKRSINSVQVMGRSASTTGENRLLFPIFRRDKFEMVTRSEAVLDGNLYGFYTDPLGSINIPMAPVALNANNWHNDVEKLVDPTLATPASGPLPYGDMTVLLGGSEHDPETRKPGVYAPVLSIGTTNVSDALTQLDHKNPGVTPAQYGRYLASHGNQPFALDPKSLTLAVASSPQIASADLNRLELNLQNLKDRRLVWPLYADFREHDGAGEATITGFVAARIVQVKKLTYSVLMDQDGKPRQKSLGSCGDRDRQGHDHRSDDRNSERKKGLCVEFSAIQLTLRPTMLATGTGMVFVKDWPTGTQHQFRFPNAYVKRIRLVK
jgi:hypothetical protein